MKLPCVAVCLCLLVAGSLSVTVHAGKPADTTKLTKRNYAPARLTTLLANIDSFTTDKSTKEEKAGAKLPKSGTTPTSPCAPT
jgi:hypothetical protein